MILTLLNPWQVWKFEVWANVLPFDYIWPGQKKRFNKLFLPIYLANIERTWTNIWSTHEVIDKVMTIFCVP